MVPQTLAFVGTDFVTIKPGSVVNPKTAVLWQSVRILIVDAQVRSNMTKVFLD